MTFFFLLVIDLFIVKRDNIMAKIGRMDKFGIIGVQEVSGSNDKNKKRKIKAK